MTESVRSEWRKILTTRLWWILLLVMAGTVATFAGFFAFALVFGDADTGAPVDLDTGTMATTVYTMGVSLGYVFPVTFGALLMTAEFRHRTIQTTLIASPRRGRVIVSKLVAAIPMAIIYGVVGIASGVGVGVLAFAIAGEPLGFDEPGVTRSILLGVVALATWMLVGVGVGSVLTNQVVAIVALLAFTQFVEPILRFALGFVEPLAGVAAYLPGAAGEAIVGSSFYSASGLTDLLAPWAGFLVLLGYGILAAVIGWLVTFRKDIT